LLVGQCNHESVSEESRAAGARVVKEKKFFARSRGGRKAVTGPAETYAVLTRRISTRRPRTAAARPIVWSVTDGLSGSSRRSSAARLVPMRRAISAFEIFC